MFANPPPDLIKLYIRNVAIGFGLSAIFVGLLLWFNVGGLGGLVARSDMGWIAVLMLFLSNGVIFAGVQFAFAVMAMAEDDDDDGPQGGRRAPVLEPVAIPVRVGSPAGR